MPPIDPCESTSFIQRQRADEAALVKYALAAIRSEIPYYRSLDQSSTAITSAAIAAAMRTVLNCWEQGRLPTKSDAQDFPRVAVIDGAVMRPLPVVLRGWRVGTRAVHEAILERGSGTLTTSDVAGLSRITLAWLDLIAEAVIDAYSDASRRDAPVGDAGVRHQLILSLTTGSYSSTDVVRRRAHGAGLSLPEPALVVVAAALDSAPPTRERMTRFLGDLDLDTSTYLELNLDGRAVFLLPALDEPRLAAAATAGALHAAAVGADTLNDVSASYRTALHAIDFLASLRPPPGRVFGEAEARLAALLAEEMGGRTELGAIIAKLETASEDQLVETLHAYYETGSAESAGHQLGVHPQTVRYRLRGIRERSGLDPASGWSRFALELAVRVHVGTAAKTVRSRSDS